MRKIGFPVRVLAPRALVLGALALLAAGLGGCVADGANGSSSMLRRAQADSFAGSYLAGRYARSARDTTAAADYFLRALDEDPDNPFLLRRTFLTVLADGRYDKASELAGRVLEIDARDGIARVLLAAGAVKAGDLVQADVHLKAVGPGGFNTLLGPIAQGWLKVARGEADAVTALAPLAENQAFGPFRSYHTALMDEALGRTAEADVAYRQVVERAAAGNIRVIEAYGRMLERQGKLDAARALYREQLQRQPENQPLTEALERATAGKKPEPLVANAAEGLSEAFYGAASALNREETSEIMEVYLQLALYLRPDHIPARLLLGELYENRKRWDKAIAIYRAVGKGNGYGDLARIRLALALNETGKTDEAIAGLRELATERPARTNALIAVGDILRAKERFAEAADAYGAAIERVAKPEERHWTMFYARGIANERAKRWPSAEADFLKALELRPDQPLVLNYLGYSWVDQGVRLDEARRMIERAVELRPNDGYIVDSLGWALYRLGQYPQAVIHLERAVELRPDDPVINDHLGDAFWRVGRYSEARFQWRRALGLKPEADLVPAIERKLDQGLELPPKPVNSAARGKSG